MKHARVACPSETVLRDFRLNKLDRGNADAVRQHLETCDHCRERVAGVLDGAFVDRLPDAHNPAVAGDWRYPTLVPGESTSSFDGDSETPLADPRQPFAQSADDGRSASADSPAELRQHSDYEVLRELGRGGIGTVYVARNRMMDRLEVLKVVNPALLEQTGALERFQQEIRAAAKLNHANIVAAYRVLRIGDLLAFAMEHIEGQDLARLVQRRGALPLANAAYYAHQAALGLEHAFQKGMVHRDIKPGNLMLAIEGKRHVVKILDFGLAKATSGKKVAAGLTKSGQMLGTPEYVAPEQILDAQKSDIRADIYSLGCTLYFLLSGAPPFGGTNLYQILHAHQTREPRPLREVRAEIPAELAAVAAKMMAKDPAERYQTPVEVAKALVPFFKSGAPRAASAALAPLKPLPLTSGNPAISLTRHPRQKARRRPWASVGASATAFFALLLGMIVVIQNRHEREAAPLTTSDDGSVEARATEMVAATEPAALERPVADDLNLAKTAPSPTATTSPPIRLAELNNHGTPAPVAHYLFDGNSNDETHGTTFVKLKNVEFRDNCLYLNGKWRYDGSGYGTTTAFHTHKMDLDAFTVALRFKADDFTEQNESIFGEYSRRRLILARAKSGNLVVRALNDMKYFRELPETKIQPGEWTVVACGIDVNAKKCVAYLNGNQAGEFAIERTARAGDAGVDPLWAFNEVTRSTVSTPGVPWIQDGAGGGFVPAANDRMRAAPNNRDVFHGYVDELIIYDKLLTPEEFANIPLRPAETSAAGHVRSATPAPESLAAARQAAIVNCAPAKLVAHFLFNGNAKDEMSNVQRAELKNVKFRDDALYLSGKYDYKGKGDGYVTTLNTLPLDMSHFTVALRFKADDFDGHHHCVLASNRYFPWFYLDRSEAGNLLFALSEGEYFREVEGAKLEPQQWTVVACGADLNLGKAIVYVNGAIVQEYDVPITLERKEGGRTVSQPWTFASAQYPDGGAFHGLVDELLVYDQLLTPDEFAKIPLRVESTSAANSAQQTQGARPKQEPQPLPAFGDASFQQWLKEVHELPPGQQGEAVAKKLRERNPGFDGIFTRQAENGIITYVRLASMNLTDLSPLRALTELKGLDCRGTRVSDLSPLAGMHLNRLACGTLVSDLGPLAGMPLTELTAHAAKITDLAPLRGMALSGLYIQSSQVADLAPLTGMPLRGLDCSGTRVSDLSPLKGMPLLSLQCGSTNVSDLSPLQGLPLTSLNCGCLKVSDLSALKGMPLATLYCNVTNVSDLSPLRDLPLTTLELGGTQVSDLSPIRGMLLTTLGCSRTRVSELSALDGMPLQKLTCDFEKGRDAQILRSIKTLRTINGLPADKFWNKVDANLQ